MIMERQVEKALLELHPAPLLRRVAVAHPEPHELVRNPQVRHHREDGLRWYDVVHAAKRDEAASRYVLGEVQRIEVAQHDHEILGCLRRPAGKEPADLGRRAGAGKQ